MGKERTDAIKARNWNRTALAARGEATELLDRYLPVGSYRFLTKGESELFSARFSRRLQEVGVEYQVDFTAVAEMIVSVPAPAGDLVWLYDRTELTGALCVSASAFWRELAHLKARFGPDVTFGDNLLSFGLCFEEQENDCFLRYWGSFWPKPHEWLDRHS